MVMNSSSRNNNNTSSIEDPTTEGLNTAEGWSMVSPPDGDALVEEGDHGSHGTRDDDDDDHLYPPFASAVLIEQEAVIEEPDISVPVVGPVLQSVEVNAETGTIHIQVEHPSTEKVEQQQQHDHSESQHSSSNSSNSPLHRLTATQKFWLSVFVRKWARRVGKGSKRAALKCHATIKPLARQSVVAIQKESKRVATFVCEQSLKLEEKHHVRDKAKSSVKHVSRHVKRASTATVQTVKTVSKTTVKTIKEVEEKHHIMRKSKNSIKKGGRMIRNAWNGKPLHARPVATSSATQNGGHSHSVSADRVLLVVPEDHTIAVAVASKIPPPSSE